VHRLTVFIAALALVGGLGACSKHNAKNVYACPNKGPGVGFKGVKSGKLTVETALPATGWWVGSNVQNLSGGYEFELAKDLCAQLGIGRVRVVDVALTALEAGKTTDFDLALAHVAITSEHQKNVDLSTAYYTSGEGTQYAALLPKGSPNTRLVNAAITKLKANGTLVELAKKWLKSP